jgi:hypothetical protein
MANRSRLASLVGGIPELVRHEQNGLLVERATMMLSQRRCFVCFENRVFVQALPAPVST